jgi:hypothetical protein
LTNPAFYVAADSSAVATYSGSIADSTRDGLVILATGKRLEAGTAPVRVASYGGLLAVAALGGTVKTFPDGHTLEIPGVQDVALGDLDGDGTPDLAIAAGDEVILFLSH